jgi:hypothetical protein
MDTCLAALMIAGSAPVEITCPVVGAGIDTSYGALSIIYPFTAPAVIPSTK